MGESERSFMFKYSVTVFFIVFFLIYGFLNFWIGLRGWQFIGRNISFINPNVYWLLFLLVALSFFAGRFGEGILPSEVNHFFTQVGSYWLGFMIYFILVLGVFEIGRILNRLFHFFTPVAGQNQHLSLLAGLMVVIAVSGTVAYGWWNARNPQVTHYSITIWKDAGALKDLKVVMVSDLHLGNIVHNGRLLRLVEMIKEQDPDIVLLPGDVVDENPGPFIEQDMMDTFKQLNPRYGIYAVTGNHEYIGRKSEEIVHHLQGAGIIVLRDQAVKIADSFYLVGLDDRFQRLSVGGQGRGLKELVKGLDQSLPVILMEHQPSRVGQIPEEGIDLKLSGHTHKGQLFPFNLITTRMYAIDWGYLRSGHLQTVVSSGFGTWGPPIRVGSTPEIVKLDIRFSKN